MFGALWRTPLSPQLPCSKLWRWQQDLYSQTKRWTGVHVSVDEDIGFLEGSNDEREFLLSWLRYWCGASRAQARRHPRRPSALATRSLIGLLGIVNQLTRVEWRWIQGGMLA